jgi:cytoskeleton protein RodZ
MKITGSILKSAREQRNLSLHEIGMSLKINPKTLQAMEEGDLSKLPAKSFLRGFVKSYAIHLKLDANEVLNTFQKEVDAETKQNLALQVSSEANSLEKSVDQPKQPPKTAPPISKTFSEQAHENIFSNKTVVLSGAFVLVILIVSTAKLVEKYQKERVIDRHQIQKIHSDVVAINEPKEPVKTSAPLPMLQEITIVPPSISQISSMSEVKKPTNEAKESKKENKEVAKEVPAVKEVPVAKETPAVKEVAVVEKKAVAPPVKAEQPVAAKPDTEKPAELTPPAKPTEVIIEALHNVQVKYSLGDGKSSVVDLAPDELHTFKSKTVVELDISDGGAVSLIVNGRERGVPGSIGKPIKLKYPKQ